MDFDSQAVVIGVNAKEFRPTYSSKHIFVDVVFIDKSHEILPPLLYQLKNDALRTDEDLETFRRNGYLSLSENAFAMVGEVIVLDKKKKQIQLRNQDTVAYKYLITATGLSQTTEGYIHDQEVSAGFHALSEALRIHKNFDQLIPFSHTRLQPDHTQKHHGLTDPKQCEAVTIQKLIKTLASYDPSTSLNLTLAGTNRRLYEVQL